MSAPQASPAVALRRARPEEAPALAEISRRAFHTDLAFGAPGPTGPPGYDSPDWQVTMMAAGDYHAIVVADTLAGGAVVFGRRPGEYELGRLFLDPRWHGRGIGRTALGLLLAAYPQARRWNLDTPVWNQRTRRLYESVGFVAVGECRELEGPDLVLYERRML